MLHLLVHVQHDVRFAKLLGGESKFGRQLGKFRRKDVQADVGGGDFLIARDLASGLWFGELQLHGRSAAEQAVRADHAFDITWQRRFVVDLRLDKDTIVRLARQVCDLSDRHAVIRHVCPVTEAIRAIAEKMNVHAQRKQKRHGLRRRTSGSSIPAPPAPSARSRRPSRFCDTVTFRQLLCRWIGSCKILTLACGHVARMILTPTMCINVTLPM